MAAPSNTIARLTGVAYLGIIFSGIFAEFFVRMSLVDSASPSSTASRIASSAGLFRAGLAADVFMIALDVCVASGLYMLLRKEDHGLALLATAFRLIQASILGANLMNMARALHLAVASSAEASLGATAKDAMVLASMELHGLVYDLGLIFFGLCCLALGRLLWTSRLVPRLLGGSLAISGLIYIVGSLTAILAPQLAPTFDPVYGFTVLSELALAAWLAVKGGSRVDGPQPPSAAIR